MHILGVEKIEVGKRKKERQLTGESMAVDSIVKLKWGYNMAHGRSLCFQVAGLRENGDKQQTRS